MIILRKFLIFLRKRFEQDRLRLYLIAVAATITFTLTTIAVDAFLPFGGFLNLLRSMLLVPTALSIFTLSYTIGLELHFWRVNNNNDWIPYRTRFSPSWRRRIALVVGAVIFVLAQAGGAGAGYTFTASILGAGVIALLAFLRTSPEEASRESLGIPDARDIAYRPRKK